MGRSGGHVRRVGLALFVTLILVVAFGFQTAPATRGSTFPPVATPTRLTKVARPPGASVEGGTDHWYRAPTADGHSVEFGVYLPATPIAAPTPTVVVLHGGDGLRRSTEELARGYAASGFIGIAACWFDQPEATLVDDAVSCSGGPTFKGTEVGAVDDLDTLVAAVGHLPWVDPARVAIVGHSYGGAVALLRASDRGTREPIVAVSAPLAAKPACCALRSGDRYPLDHVGDIAGPVLVAHAEADPIALVEQARRFVAARPATEARYYPKPAGHAFPWQTVQSPGAAAGITFASQFLADTTAWIVLRFP